ncbi:tetraacyldisaccharide 4'-kinase [Cyclobacterium sp.]|uniref:tetraacyldisaccharide 4'-kinase n=1 Tax=Cyclobacterium sp. TaxID=1966343 RepID=UPI0019A88B2A|nr:tetraacyldisaccharide 4'-kinase [Cyclobacterium sp.]MBD3631199.1 tetraacyldisaccharide 4'-kinase [Cyclobacterium sp.]
MRFPDFLLFPFALLYGGITAFRNHLFDAGIKRSQQFEVPTIVAGNLAVGGTGKTPFIEFLIKHLSPKVNLAVLSRGYGRKTRGFILADDTVGPSEIGDEPFQIFSKFKDHVRVAVGEERILAIPMILAVEDGVQGILLDDAYQHRYLKADLYVLLTTYEQPFYEDFLLPMGRLREGRKNANRADAVVVTKCPDILSPEEKIKMTAKIKAYTREEVPVYFAGLRYGKPYPIEAGEKSLHKNLVLLTGIVDYRPLLNELNKNHRVLEVISFPDHHRYSESDMLKIRNVCDKYRESRPAIVTTEKDAVKLRDKKLLKILPHLPIFALPVEVDMEKNDEQDLLRRVHEVIKSKNSVVEN